MSHILEFLDLVDTPSSFSGVPGRPVRVNDSATALVFSPVAAEFISLVTTSFDGLLSGTDTTVQTALETLDDLTHGDIPGLLDDDHPQYPKKTGWNLDYSSYVSISFTDATRTFSISPTGASFEYWIQGVKYTKTTEQTVVIDDTQGLWFIYFDGATLTASQTPWSIRADSKAFVAAVYWDTAVNDEAVRVEYELHSWVMDAATHEYGHETFGARWGSGLAVSENPANQLEVSPGVIHDEDLHFEITDETGGTWDQPLSPLNAPVLYRTGASGVWAQFATSTTPVYLSSNVPQVNVFSGGTWTWADVGVAKYFAYWVVASGDINYPVFLVPGQGGEANNADGAREDNTLVAMQFGSLPTPEHKVIARVIMQRSGSSPYYTIDSVDDYRFTVDEDTAVVASAGDHGSLTGLPDVADHPGYVTLDGARALTADWDAGGYEIRALTFESDVATGTPPLVVASTTAVTNLNADLLDGNHAAAFALAGHDHDSDYLALAGGTLSGDLIIDYGAALQVDVGAGETPTDAVQGDSFGIVFGDSGVLCKLVGSGAAPTYNATDVSLDGHSHVEDDITDLVHTDADAIHDNVAGEINALTSVTAALGDYVLIEDASDSWNKKKVTAQGIANLATGDGIDTSAIHDDTAGEINALTNVDPTWNDRILIEDASNSWAKRAIYYQRLFRFDEYGRNVILYVLNNSGVSISKGEIVYLSGDSSGIPQVTKADADAASTGTGMLMMMYSTTGNGAYGWGITLGVVNGFSSLTAGAVQYLSTTAGGRTQTAPSGSGDIVRVIGHAISSSEIYFNPSNAWVEIA